MKVFYWSPFINEVATIKAVTNSVISLKKFSKKKINPTIIDAVGEWDSKKDYLKVNKIDLIKLINVNIINYLPKFGFLKSRFTYFIIFFFTVFKLHKLLKSAKPDFVIVHLITFIPLVLLLFFNYKTRFILRISGYPRLTFFRSLLWRLVNKKIYFITAPTLKTSDMIKEKKIFNLNKIKYLPDPVLRVEEFQKNKKKKSALDKELSIKNSLISIGRLTPQKNFAFLINTFAILIKKYENLNLFILGDGEEMNKLKKIINKLKLNKKIFLIGYKKNVFEYLKNSRLFILPSLWEDPGFVLLEAAYLNKTILSSNCPNGPAEILDNGKNGFLFESNSPKSFLENFDKMYLEDKKTIFKKKIRLKKKCKEFTLFNHYKILNSILSTYED